MRGVAHHTGALTLSWPRGVVSRLPMALSAASSRSSARALCSYQAVPASVRLRCRLERCSRRAPSDFSSWATCLLAIGAEMPSTCAAWAKLPASTTSRNTRRLVSRSMVLSREEIDH